MRNEVEHYREEDLRSEAFAAVNPLRKVPAAIDAHGDNLFEASVILNYLEDKFAGVLPHATSAAAGVDDHHAKRNSLPVEEGHPHHDVASSSRYHGGAGHSFRPETPEARAAVEKIVRVHDLYIASANCTQWGFTHTQGAMYLGPAHSTFTPARWGFELTCDDFSIFLRLWLRLQRKIIIIIKLRKLKLFFFF